MSAVRGVLHALLNNGSAPTNITTYVSPGFIFESISLGIDFFLSIALAIVIMWYFIPCTKHAWKNQWYVYVVTGFTIWISLFEFGMIIVDLSTALYDEQLDGKTLLSVASFHYVLFVFWEILYWAMFILSWVILPMLRAYVRQGAFTFGRKLLGAFIDNVIFYGVMGLLVAVLVVGFIVYSVIHATSSGGTFSTETIASIPTLLLSLSNAVGFLFVVLLLGFGFGSLPMHLLRVASHEKTLTWYQLNAPDASDQFHDKKDDMHVLLCNVRHLEIHSRGSTITPREREQLQDDEPDLPIDDKGRWVKAIKENFGKYYNPSEVTAVKPEKPVKTRKEFEKLHKEVIATAREVRTREYQFRQHIHQSLFVEDLVNAKKATKRVKHPYLPAEERGCCVKLWSKLRCYREKFLPRAEWILYRVLWKPLMYILFFGAIVLALIIIYHELTPIVQLFDEKLDFSILSLIFRALKSQTWLVQLLALGLISFFAYMMFYALFRIRVLSYLQFVKKHTDPTSLLFAATFLCRIMPALLFNFVNMIGISKKDGMAFFSVMAYVGKMEGLQWVYFGEYFGTFVPLLIPIVILAVILDIAGRVAKCAGFESFVLLESFFAKTNPDKLKLGQKIIKTEKKKIAKARKQLVVTEQELDDFSDEDVIGGSKTRAEDLEESDPGLSDDRLSDISSDDDSMYIGRGRGGTGKEVSAMIDI